MYVDMFQVRHSEAIIYRQWIGARKPPKKESLLALNQSSTYSGTVTSGSVKRMRKAISLLIQKSPVRKIFNPVVNKTHDFSIGFVTLTLADQGKDTALDVYKKCLAPWLKWARYKGMRDYVWKAELQKRGTLHYHIAINVFLHYQIIQDKWNYYQKKAGYLDDFAMRHKHFRPNSVDIHAVQKVGNVEAYITKYLIKGGGGKIKGKIWDCSKELKAAKYYTTELSYKNLDLMRMYCTKEIIGEHSTIFRLPPGKPGLILDRTQMKEYRSHLLNI